MWQQLHVVNEVKLWGEMQTGVVPEIPPPVRTAVVPMPTAVGSVTVDAIPGTPYVNASVYTRTCGIRLNVWLKHPDTVALISAFSEYYRRATRRAAPQCVVYVRQGPRCFHGYYVHSSLFEALAVWCHYERLKGIEKTRLPLPQTATMAVHSPRLG